jgi:hypothetical protein
MSAIISNWAWIGCQILIFRVLLQRATADGAWLIQWHVRYYLFGIWYCFIVYWSLLLHFLLLDQHRRVDFHPYYFWSLAFVYLPCGCLKSTVSHSTYINSCRNFELIYFWDIATRGHSLVILKHPSIRHVHRMNMEDFRTKKGVTRKFMSSTNTTPNHANRSTYVNR